MVLINKQQKNNMAKTLYQHMKQRNEMGSLSTRIGSRYENVSPRDNTNIAKQKTPNVSVKPTEYKGGKVKVGDYSKDRRSPDVRKVDSILAANKDKEWVNRLYDKKPESIQIKGQKGRSTHLMESADGKVYPRVDRDPKTKKLVNMGDTSYNYHTRTKNYIKFKDDKEAQWFGENYKKGTGVLKGKL